MRVATRKDPLKVDGAHVCAVSHITTTELRRYLTETEVAGGLGNRFLLALVRRSKKLPAGGNLSPDAVEHFAGELGRAVEAAKRVGLMTRTPEAEALWADIYNAVDDDVDGLFGAITARAEAQMLRLSLTYALLDGSAVVDIEHIKAAHAVWVYCEASAAYIFGGTTGDPVTDKLLEALLEVGEDGLSLTQQNHLFGRNVPAERLDQARNFLEKRGLVATVTKQSGGRPTIVTVLAN